MEIIQVPYGDALSFVYVPVEAERFTIDGFGEFFVHHKADYFSPNHIDSDLYEVTEADTKCAVPSSVASSKSKAMQRARAFLMEKGAERFLDAKKRAHEILAKGPVPCVANGGGHESV